MAPPCDPIGRAGLASHGGQLKSFNVSHLCDRIRDEASGKHAPLSVTWASSQR